MSPVADDIRTADPDIVIELMTAGYKRYRRLSDGRRWEVRGVCDRRGDCIVGAVLRDGTVVTQQMVDALRLTDVRLISEMDVPVTPEFNICCGKDRFTYRELPRA